MGDTDEVEDAAEARQHERASTVEDILSEVREDLGAQSYPTTSEDLASTYADSPIELPNETESLGSAFGRMDDRFEDSEEAYEALVREYEGGKLVSGETGARTPGERATWSEERVDEARAPADEEIEGERQRSVERAKQAQQEEYEDGEGTDGEGDGDG